MIRYMLSLVLALCAQSSLAQIFDPDPGPESHIARQFPVHGVDVSHHQGQLNWYELRRAGVNFVYIKATEGRDHADTRFAQNWRGARSAEISRGAYHFLSFCSTPREQANWFIQHVPRQPGMLPPALDAEWNHHGSCKNRPSPGTIRNMIVSFLDIVEQHYGQRPIIYTDPKFYRNNALHLLSSEEFWLRSTAHVPEKTYPSQRWTFWQYSGTGMIPGAQTKIDLNVFNGSAEEWVSWVLSRRIE